MSLAIPEEAVIHNGHVVGDSLPFAHQNGPGPRKWNCRCLRPLGCAVVQNAIEQPIKLICDRPYKAAVEAFLPRVGNSEGEDIASEARRWFVAKFLRPERTQFGAGPAGQTRRAE